MLTVIVVTHNSDKYIDLLFSSIGKDNDVVIVDSGSSSTVSLEKKCQEMGFKLIKESNVGFAKANNIGYKYCTDKTEFVAFVNPDLFINNDWLSHGVQLLKDPKNSNIAVLSSVLERFDIKNNCPLGIIDSIGIAKKLFWYDIGQGNRIDSLSNIDKQQLVERDAICGALMLCRKSALDSVLLNHKEVFWERLFMYKEDIELSLRLRRAGYKLAVDLASTNYHCRGWQERKLVPKWLKIISARNDVLVSFKYDKFSLPLFISKYIYVRFFE